MKKILLLLSICITCSFVVQAQEKYTQTIRGVVVDAETETPISNAVVMLLNGNVNASTDSVGRFRLEKVPVGRHSISVRLVGYNFLTLNNLIVTSGKETVLNIKLEAKVVNANSVVIKADFRKDQPINTMANVSARSFSTEETERYAGSLGDPSRMAANFAGVSSATDQRNDIIIRGNSPLGLLWRMDGVDIPNPNHFGSLGSTGGPVSMLNNNVLANSDFYTAAFPAEFGNAISGVFDLRMRSGNNEKREFVGQIGFNGFELGAEGYFSKNSKASYLINFRYSTMEVMNKFGMNFGTGTAIPQYKDLTFKFDFPTQKYGHFSLFGIGGNSYIELLGSKSTSYGFGNTDIYYGAKTGALGLTHTLKLSENSRLKTTFAATAIQNNADLDSLSHQGIRGVYPFVREKDREIKYSASVKYSNRFNLKNTLNVGVTGEFYKVMYNGKYYDSNLEYWIQNTNTDGAMNQYRGFVEYQHKFTDELTLNTGIHTQLLEINKTYSIEPRAGLKWKFTDSQSLNFGFGVHGQAQTRVVYVAYDLVDTLNKVYKQTNKDLDFTKSNHYVLAYDWLIKDNLRLKFEAYYQSLYNVPVSAEHPQFSILNQGDGFTFNAYENMVNKGTGKNYGIELTIEQFLTKGFYYLVTASIFDSKYKGYDGIERNSAFNNNYIFNALAGYELRLSEKNTLVFDIKGVLAGGKRHMPIDIEKSQQKARTEYDWTHAYEKRYADYFRLNARIAYRRNGKNLNQEWALDLQNITNHENVFVQSWDVVAQKINTEYQMSFMPMMTYRIQF